MEEHEQDVRPRDGYEPRGAARALFRCREPEVLLSGPAGTGKSRACLEKLRSLAEQFPGCRLLIARKTRASLTESGLVTLERDVLPPGHAALMPPVLRRVRQAYRFPNGSEMAVGGMDTPTRILSTEWDAVYVQEAIELEEWDWEYLSSRLRSGRAPYQQLLADTNPAGAGHWLKRRADRGQVRLLESRHEENPRLWDADAGRWTPQGAAYIARLDALTGARRPRLRYGRWVQAEGVVYPEWDRARHVVERLPRGAHAWRRIRSIDFGYTNPFVCQWWAIDPDGRMWLYREIYRTERLVAEHAREILRLGGGERFEATVCDHDAEDRATLEAAGIPTRPAFKGIRRGIEAVSARLAPAGDGRPRLFLLAGALAQRDELLAERLRPCSTEQEFDGYCWPPGGDGKSRPEAPADVDNHGMDALRYAAAYADGLGRKRLRAF